MAGEAQIEPPATRSTEAPKKISKEENGLCGLDQKPIGFRAALNEKRQQQHDYTTPQPWIVQKVAILLVIGLLGLSTYVYIGRVCLPMIQEATGVLGSRTLGIIYISFFCPLLLMTLWTYVKVVLTPPGFARDHCPKVPPPAPPTDAGPRYGTTREWDVDTYDESIRSWDRSPSSPGGLSPQVSRNSGDPTESSTAARKSEQPGSPTQEGTPGIMPVSPYSQGSTSNGNGQEADGSVRELDALPGVASHHANSNLKTDGAGGVPEPLPAAARTSSSLPPPLHSRRPPRHPLLAEEYRYCSRDGFIKPMRAHHCRICATCVLNFDHHCPWIGQCVGARNRKFFVNFVFWAALYTIYTAVSLIAVNARATLRHRDIDPLQIVIIILGLLFGLFTGGLFITHTMLIMLNMTTVEQYSISSMKERERASLGQMLPWWDFGGRRRTIRKWDEEWGALQTEGNLWYLDNRRTNWEATMGKKVSWWFLPIGKSEGDGLVYPTNPRFTSDGKWRRRKDWPEELR